MTLGRYWQGAEMPPYGAVREAVRLPISIP